MAKKRVGRYPKEFRRIAVERLKKCDNIVALARELGVHRRLLYKWRDQLDPAEVPEEWPPQNSRESTLRKEVSQLKRLLADKAVEVDFFKVLPDVLSAPPSVHLAMDFPLCGGAIRIYSVPLK